MYPRNKTNKQIKHTGRTHRHFSTLHPGHLLVLLRPNHRHLFDPSQAPNLGTETHPTLSTSTCRRQKIPTYTKHNTSHTNTVHRQGTQNKAYKTREQNKAN